MATIREEIPQFLGQPVYSKKTAFHTKAGMDAPLEAVIRDDNGNPINLGNSGPYGQASLKAYFQEGSQPDWFPDSSDVTIIDRDGGRISFSLTDQVKNVPGIYNVLVKIFDKDDKWVDSREYFVYIDPSPDQKQSTEFPPISRVRLALFDTSPIENELLGQKQFNLTDICIAAIEAVDEWNTSPPFTPRLMVTTNSIWDCCNFITGVKLKLYSMLVEHYRKNSLAYQAAGIAINDSKLQEYSVALAEAQRKYLEEVMRLKYHRNMMNTFRIIP